MTPALAPKFLVGAGSTTAEVDLIDMSDAEFVVAGCLIVERRADAIVVEGIWNLVYAAVVFLFFVDRGTFGSRTPRSKCEFKFRVKPTPDAVVANFFSFIYCYITGFRAK